MLRLACSACLLLSTVPLTFAQGFNGLVLNSRRLGPTPLESQGSDVFISGKVVLSDGSPLTEPAAIETVCSGRKHTEAYTDTGGSFTFQFSATGANSMRGGIGDGDNSVSNSNGFGGSTRSLRGCDLRAALPGFNSDSVDLTSKFSGSGNIDVGRIALRRMGSAAASTVSASTAGAPESATKAFFKGKDDQRKGKWDAAQKHFQEAIRSYPQYASAYFELGRTQVLQNNVPGARQSFEQASKADPKFVSPYQALAELAARDQHWAEVIRLTSTVLGLSPGDLPQVWFMNAIGNFNMRDLPAAEKSLRAGLNLDVQHRMPKMEYLLSLVLAQRGQYSEAAQHMQSYLKLVPTSSDVATAQKQLALMTRLMATGTTTAAATTTALETAPPPGPAK